MRAPLIAVFAVLASRASGASAACPAEIWDGASPVDARLADANCRLRDIVPGSTADFAAKQYTLDLRTRGYLNVEAASAEFDTVLLLTDARFRQIAANDDAVQGRTDSRITASLAADTYYLFVVSKRSTGAFALRGTFDLGTGCQIRDFPNARVTGTLGGQSCRQLDASYPSGSSTPSDLYSIKIDSPKVLSALMQSRALDSLLLLIDAKTGQTITGDDDSADGFADALLVTSVPPGEYVLAATIAGNTVGAYDLQVRLDDPRPCNTGDISPAGSASGQLVADDCRVLDVFAPDEQENRMDLFRLTISEPGVLTADATSNAFPTAILLLDKDRKSLQSAAPQANSAAARLIVSLAPGEYFLGVAHTVLQAGAYQLRTSFERPRPCDAEALAPGGSASGRLSSGDCRILDIAPGSVDTTAARPFKVTLEKRGRLTLDMTSADIDSFLWLLDGANRAVAQDDNSGGGRNARISVQLAPGAYTAIANTGTTQGGGFEIKAAVEDPPACPVAKATAGETVQGQLAEGDCATRDLMLSNASIVPARYHEITLADAAVLTVDASSFAFAPSLILVDSEGKRIAADVLDARTSALGLGGVHIRRELPAGTYGIIVTATGGRAGDYSIRTATAAP